MTCSSRLTNFLLLLSLSLFPSEFPFLLADSVESRIYDYLEIIILFGFVSIFIISFPSSGLLPFCIIAWELEIVIDAMKLATGFRKPLPRRAEDIGVWEDVLNMMAGIAIVSNAYQVIYMAKFDYTLRFALSGADKSNIFWLLCVLALILRWITLKILHGEPFHVNIQLMRRAFLSDKLVMNRPDANFEDSEKKDSAPNADTILNLFFPGSVVKPAAGLFEPRDKLQAGKTIAGAPQSTSSKEIKINI